MNQTLEIRQAVSTTPWSPEPLREDRFRCFAARGTQKMSSLRRLVSAVVDLEATGRQCQGFRACGRAYDLGRFQYVSVHHDAMHITRTMEQIQTSGLDHWVISLRRSGSGTSRVGNNVLHSSPGTVSIESLAVPIDMQVTRTHCTMIFLSRDHFLPLAPRLDAACHKPLEGGLFGAVAELLSSLEQWIRPSTIAEIPVIVSFVTALLHAALEPSDEHYELAGVPATFRVLEKARRLIHTNLKSPELGPEMLCKTMRISRRQLYYVFERHGGIARYIRKRRLLACHDAIVDASDHRLVSTIAYDYGFTDAALFSRNFLTEFGYSPTQARDIGMPGCIPLSKPPANFSEWLLQCRG